MKLMIKKDKILKSVMKRHTKELDTVRVGVLHLFSIDTIKKSTTMPKYVNGELKLGSTQLVLGQFLVMVKMSNVVSTAMSSYRLLLKLCSDPGYFRPCFHPAPVSPIAPPDPLSMFMILVGYGQYYRQPQQ
ncbi:hypothetical protein LSH36_1973g00001 [Paralvinella palmiformis]|uniref:Uncharacterized protein n=1 Tax=Paralvinella palmiformis TaxID=53620 RepID=A0AAD9IR91_9ANNE|nr:hypothetical protein LSH36_1973g00001 [Paralvinella palmiformis]